MHKSKIIFVLRNSKTDQKRVKRKKHMKVSLSSFFETYLQYLSSSCSFDFDEKEGQKNNLIQMWCNPTPQADKAEARRALCAYSD